MNSRLEEHFLSDPNPLPAAGTRGWWRLLTADSSARQGRPEPTGSDIIRTPPTASIVLRCLTRSSSDCPADLQPSDQQLEQKKSR